MAHFARSLFHLPHNFQHLFLFGANFRESSSHVSLGSAICSDVADAFTAETFFVGFTLPSTFSVAFARFVSGFSENLLHLHFPRIRHHWQACCCLTCLQATGLKCVLGVVVPFLLGSDGVREVVYFGNFGGDKICLLSSRLLPAVNGSHTAASLRHCSKLGSRSAPRTTSRASPSVFEIKKCCNS